MESDARTSSTQAVNVQSCRHCGSAAPTDVHFCPHCEKILTLARHGDYFSFFGLPRKLAIDRRELDERLRALSRQFHPDYFANAAQGERLAALERSSYLNDAYRVLKDPVSRVEYLLKLESPAGDGHGPSRGARPDPKFLEEVFSHNERIEAAQAAREEGAPDEEIRRHLEEARRPVDEKRAEHDRRLRELAAAWDAKLASGAPRDERQPELEALKRWLAEQSYISNLVAAIDRELDLV